MSGEPGSGESTTVVAERPQPVKPERADVQPSAQEQEGVNRLSQMPVTQALEEMAGVHPATEKKFGEGVTLQAAKAYEDPQQQERQDIRTFTKSTEEGRRQREDLSDQLREIRRGRNAKSQLISDLTDRHTQLTEGVNRSEQEITTMKSELEALTLELQGRDKSVLKRAIGNLGSRSTDKIKGRIDELNTQINALELSAAQGAAGRDSLGGDIESARVEKTALQVEQGIKEKVKDFGQEQKDKLEEVREFDFRAKFEELQGNISRFSDLTSRYIDRENRIETDELLQTIANGMDIFDKAIQDNDLFRKTLESVNELAEAELKYRDVDEDGIGTDFIKSNMDVIVGRINATNETTPQEATEVNIEGFRSFLILSEKEQETELLEANLDILLNNIGDMRSFILAGRALDQFFDYESEQQPLGYQRINKALKDIIIKKSGIGKGLTECGEIVWGLRESGDGAIYAAAILMNQIFEERGFDLGIVRDWSGSERAHLEAIEALEKERPGIVNVLHSEYGISCFGLYPQELLIQQYDSRDDRSRPYGIYLSARGEPRGTHQRGLINNLLLDLNREMERKFLLRIVEAGGRLSVIKNLLKLDKRYGLGQKIQFAIVTGHGEKDRIIFGTRSDPDPDLMIQDLDGRTARRSGEIFVEHPTIILESCTTGAEGGIAQKLSEAMQAEVIAPGSPGYLNAISFNLEGEKAMLDAKFGSIAFSAPPKKMRYVNGELIKAYVEENSLAA